MQHPEFSHKTYFSENALLPGLVRGEFNDDRAIMAYLDDLKYGKDLSWILLVAFFSQ